MVYRPLYGEGKLWVRPLEIFVERTLQDGSQVPRFALSSLKAMTKASVFLLHKSVRNCTKR